MRFLIIILLCLLTSPVLALTSAMQGCVNTSYTAGGGCTGGSDGNAGNHSTANVGEGTAICENSCSTNYFYYSSFTPDEDGTVSKIHCETYSASASYRCEIRADNGTLLAYGPEHEGTGATSPGDIAHDDLTVVGGGSLCLAAATTYKIGVWIEADPWSSSFVAGASWGSGTGRYATMTAYDSTWDGTGTQQENGFAYRASVNNSASAF